MQNSGSIQERPENIFRKTRTEMNCIPATVLFFCVFEKNVCIIGFSALYFCNIKSEGLL